MFGRMYAVACMRSRGRLRRLAVVCAGSGVSNRFGSRGIAPSPFHLAYRDKGAQVDLDAANRFESEHKSTRHMCQEGFVNVAGALDGRHRAQQLVTSGSPRSGVGARPGMAPVKLQLSQADQSGVSFRSAEVGRGEWLGRNLGGRLPLGGGRAGAVP